MIKILILVMQYITKLSFFTRLYTRIWVFETGVLTTGNTLGILGAKTFFAIKKQGLHF